MSTTITAPSAGTEPMICELLAAWQEAIPPMDAPADEVADWFERSVHLLEPITQSPAHPQHADACALAAENSHDALALRGCSGSAGAR